MYAKENVTHNNTRDSQISSIVGILNISLEMFKNHEIKRDILLPHYIERLFIDDDTIYKSMVAQIFIDLETICNYKTISITLNNNNMNLSMAFLPKLKLLVVDTDDSLKNSYHYISYIQGIEIIYLNNTENDIDYRYLLNEIKEYLNI